MEKSVFVNFAKRTFLFRINIFLLVLFFPFISLYADAHLDSLYDAIEKHHGLPGIEAKLQIAFELRKTDLDEVDRLCGQAYENAKQLEETNLQARALYYKGLAYYYHDLADTALKYLHAAKELYKKDQNNIQLAKVLCMIGSNYLGVTGDQSKAITYYNEALSYARKTEDHKTMAMIYSQLSNIFRMNGSYREAIEFIYKSKEHYEAISFHEGIAWVSYSIGRIYSTMSLYEEARREYLQGLEQYRMLPETVGSLTGIAICMDELGLTMLELGEPEKAREYNLEAQKIYKNINSEFGMSNALKYLARLEYSYRNYDDAIQYLDRSLSIKKQINDVLGFPGVYELYGKILMDHKKYQAAIDSLNVGLGYAEQNSQRNRMMNLNKKLAEIYAQLGEFDKAYEYRSTQMAINDSISQAKSTRALTQLEALYELEIKENKILELEREKRINEINLEREITVRNLLLIILAMAIVFAFFFMKLFASNRQTNEILKKNEKELRELNATKDKFTSIIAHDLKSPFNSILGFSNLLQRYSEQKDFEKTREFSHHIQEVSIQTYKLLENLLDWSRSQTGKIQFKPKAVDMRILIKNALDSVSPDAKNKNIDFIKDIDTIAVMIDEKMMHTVLQNLFSNAIKYSHPGGKVHISAKEEKNAVILKIKDEGVGMDNDTLDKLFHIDKTVSTPGTEGEKGTGLGLILSKEFIQKHRGKIFAESIKNEGSCFTVVLPL